jgi:hypothetical protein
LGVHSGVCINQHGSSPGGGVLPLEDALALGAWWELPPLVAGIKKEVNIVNRDDSTEVA